MRLGATDPDIETNADVLRYSLVDGPAGMLLDPVSGDLTYIPSRGTSGELTVVVQVTDLAQAADTTGFILRVLNINQGPVRLQSLPDITLDEDSGSTLVVADIGTIFNDPNGDALNFEILSEVVQIQAQLRGGGLTLTPSQDFFGSGQVMVQAEDPQGLAISDTFRVTIAPINDPPQFFTLLSPTDDDSLRTRIIFLAWEPAQDPEGETVEYILHLIGSMQDTTIERLTGTEFNFDGSSFLQPSQSYQWHVEASDGLDTTRSAAVHQFLVYLPETFFLNPGFPNPFNGSTTFNYGLPVDAPVRITVYNAMGQEVVRLLNEEQPVGFYRIEWDGLDHRDQAVSSGVYFLVVKAAKARRVRKMMLIR